MVPFNGPWAILGKSLSYIVKLAPILWWALPSGPVGRQPASSQKPPMRWIPDNWLGACQPPGPPASPRLLAPQTTCPLPGSQPAVSHPPRCQLPLPSSQSKGNLTCGQLNQSLATGPKLGNNPCPPEQGQTKVSSLSINSTPSQWGSGAQTTWLGPNFSQTKPSGTKIDSANNLAPIFHLATGQQEAIGSHQELPNQPQITGEQDLVPILNA
ncbi:hypothetical protein DSO57_1018493 [Entomophthora muscae]|uniref:Uncharacterized protein n=1 Tax=Entomophthora muscae TaxID=34485 RepID=A0ACC2TSB8_9FUNG|nr:hypothetical protein DSO57_1018493 [Entomophthora muscae]